MKNTLAMVQAIVTQTFQAAPIVEEGRDRISGRLATLSDAQNILTSTSTSLAPIAEVVQTALAPHRTRQGRFAIADPDVDLAGPQAPGLSLALYELATNAAKRGAPSNEAGRVAIGWSLSDTSRFDFTWQESDGPPVSVPTQPGFGSKLLQRVVGTYFEGEARLHFDTAGIRFHLTGEIQPEAH